MDNKYLKAIELQNELYNEATSAYNSLSSSEKRALHSKFDLEGCYNKTRSYLNEVFESPERSILVDVIMAKFGIVADEIIKLSSILDDLSKASTSLIFGEQVIEETAVAHAAANSKLTYSFTIDDQHAVTMDLKVIEKYGDDAEIVSLNVSPSSDTVSYSNSVIYFMILDPSGKSKKVKIMNYLEETTEKFKTSIPSILLSECQDIDLVVDDGGLNPEKGDTIAAFAIPNPH
jgi:hypothetical protein